MKTIIIDDELLNIKNLEVILKENFHEIEVVKSFVDVEVAIDFLMKNTIDLVFLDINMPKKDGFEFLRSFPERHFQVVFVTAYEEHAIKAIKAGATDYILKPLLKEELTNAIQKANERYHELVKFSAQNKIVLSHSDGKTIVAPNDILYIQGIDNICKIHLVDKRKVIISKTLKHFEESLDDRFFRIHKSFLANLEHAFGIISKTEHFLELKENIKIPISRRNLRPLNHKLSAH